MLSELLTPTMGIEIFLLLIISGLLALIFNGWAATRSERLRKLRRQQRITNFLDTAKAATITIRELKELIPTADMQGILNEATAKELKTMRAAIAEIEAEAAALRPALTAQIEQTLTEIGLLQAPKKDNKGGDKSADKTEQSAGNNGNNDGKKLIGELLGRLKQAGKADLDFNKLMKLLKDGYSINSPAEFAALDEAKRQEIEAALKA